MPHKVKVSLLDDVDTTGLSDGQLLLWDNATSKWKPHTPAASGMTNPMTTQDDIIIGGTAGAPARLAKGSDSQVLTVDPTSHHLAWDTPASPGMSNPMTTAADLIVGGTSGTPARLAKGSDGQVLTVNATTHLLDWETPSSGFTDPTTTKGDLIVHGTSTTRLPVGSNTQVLTADSTQTLGVKWATPGSGGASTADHYIVGQGGEGDTDLSNKIIIPRLSSDLGIRVAGANDWEFDSSSTTGWSSFAGGGAVTFDFNSTSLSMARMQVANNGTTDKFGGIIHSAPSTPYTLTAHLTDSTMPTSQVWPVIFVSDSSTAAGNGVYMGLYGGQPRAGANSNMQTFAGFNNQAAGGMAGQTQIFVRLYVHSVSGTLNVDASYSHNGRVWRTLVSGFTTCTSAGYFGFAIDAYNADTDTVWDFARFS